MSFVARVSRRPEPMSSMSASGMRWMWSNVFTRSEASIFWHTRDNIRDWNMPASEPTAITAK